MEKKKNDKSEEIGFGVKRKLGNRKRESQNCEE